MGRRLRALAAMRAVRWRGLSGTLYRYLVDIICEWGYIVSMLVRKFGLPVGRKLYVPLYSMHLPLRRPREGALQYRSVRRMR